MRALADLRTQLANAGPMSTARRKSTASIQVTLDSAEEKLLGDEGFHIQVGEQGASVSAAGWRGLNYGILDLVRRLAESSEGSSLPGDLDVRERPGFDLRGVYAHTAWVYNYPFALRAWHLRDWERYVDLLAYQRVNLLQIWSPISIMSVPLSAADRDYLAMFKEVIRYARDERGFRSVWVGDAANDVGLPSKTPVATRQYYVVHSLLNPAVPAQMKDIIDSRRSLYQVDSNADGYWVIDSDPGNWPGSPSQDFVRILEANRKLIDQITNQGGHARLIYWIWQGWGTQSTTENITSVLKGWQEAENGRPLTVLACSPTALEVASRFRLIPQTVWFPYGAIEGEPSSPYTALRFEAIRDSFKGLAAFPNLKGVLGNAQTPLIQIPNIRFYQRIAWDRDYASKPQLAVLEDTARDTYPEITQDVAHGWLLLSEHDSAASRATAIALERAVKQNGLGPAGVIGRYVSPDGRWLISNLAAQLRVHADAIDLAAGLNTGAPYDQLSLLTDHYFLSALAMVKTTGFRPALDKQGNNLLPFFNWFYANEDWAQISSSWKSFSKTKPKEAEGVCEDLKRRYSGGDPDSLESVMVEFLVGNPPKRPADFKYAN
jgi:hypothetical protein